MKIINTLFWGRIFIWTATREDDSWQMTDDSPSIWEAITIPKSLHLTVEDWIFNISKSSKKSISHKPDSVSDKSEGHHLSCPVIASGIIAAYPFLLPVNGKSNGPPEPFAGTGIYVALQHARFTRCACYHEQLWALTSHFHPYVALRRHGYFLWHFLFPIDREPAVNRCIALCCPDFPSRINSERWPADRRAKLQDLKLRIQD